MTTNLINQVYFYRSVYAIYMQNREGIYSIYMQNREGIYS
jgi:hypothetical protein